ncbi:MAG: Sec-independent protein translocase protein TatB [Bauldia sp.]|nr:Sec-independent protein translocase protein TatB [Bauldia sp.]MCW5717160.1 Sec-independent protein translocase protein TatB [Bauldia sp.]
MDFGLSWVEMMIIAVVAIIVVGPKDLPQLLRTVGQWFGQMKRMARDFQRQLDQAVRDDELDKLRKEVADLHRTTSDEIHRGLGPSPDRHLPRRTVTVDGKVMPAPEMVQKKIPAPAETGEATVAKADAPLDVPDTAASVEVPVAMAPAEPAGATR